VVAVVVEYTAQGCTILGRRGVREEKNRGGVRGNKGDNVSVGWAVSARFLIFLGDES
jgi:hypothetical protein